MGDHPQRTGRGQRGSGHRVWDIRAEGNRRADRAQPAVRRADHNCRVQVRALQAGSAVQGTIEWRLGLKSGAGYRNPRRNER